MDANQDTGGNQHELKPTRFSIIPLLVITVIITCILSMVVFIIVLGITHIAYGPKTFLILSVFIGLFVGSVLAGTILLGWTHPRKPLISVILLSMLSMVLFLALIYFPRLLIAQ